MKPHSQFKWLVLAILSVLHFGAQAQQAWRPFRPGLIYSFATVATTSATPSIFMLRLDSAYTTAGGDSVWAFNKLLRPTNGTVLSVANWYISSRPSRNNLLGARLTWQPGSGEFVLENVAEGSYQAAVSVRLRPQAAVGSSWVASSAPALTATLTSRVWQPVTSTAGSPSDSVATITLSSGAVLRLSRRYGLLAGPQWLAVTSNAASQWEIAGLPTTLANSPLYPATLFNMQPGDVLGYDFNSTAVWGPICSDTYELRAIQTRAVVGDSLIYTYRQQSRTVNYGYTGCGLPAGVAIEPVRTGRLAFSLRTGQSPQYPSLPLLSGEYRRLVPSNRFSIVVVGFGFSASSSGSCPPNAQTLVFQNMGPQTISNAITYGVSPDGVVRQYFSPQLGLGDIGTYNKYLSYYNRATSSGVATCGSSTNFVNLLPTRAVQAATIATLHPNPATGAATLTLAAPSRLGYALRLTDALGRLVWSAPVPVGQTNVAIPLTGQPAGLYLLHLSGAETTASWKLMHE